MFTPSDFRRLFRVSGYAVKNYLNRNTRTGLFVKLKNGLYALQDSIPPKYAIANRLYAPSYISFESALSYYNIIPETVYTVFSAAPKASREFEILNTDFVYHRVKRTLYFGYSVLDVNGYAVQIAEPTKAVADYLYFVALGKKTLNDRMDLRSINRKKLENTVRAYRMTVLEELVESVYVK